MSMTERTECTYPNCKGCRQCGIVWHISKLKDYEGVKLIKKFLNKIDSICMTFRRNIRWHFIEEDLDFFEPYREDIKKIYLKQKLVLEGFNIG